MYKFLILIIGLTIFTGCGFSKNQEPSPEVKDKIELVQKKNQFAELRLVQNKISPKTFKISVKINNPENKEIISARTWLAYNSELLKVVKIDTQKSDFDLAAPKENDNDAQEGLIKIWRSLTNKTVNLNEIQVAEIIVEKLQTGTTILDFYDYHEDTSGHTTVNVIEDGQIRNILQKPVVPGIVLE